MDPQLAIQKAIIAALRANASFAAAAEVWDRVPQGTATPYVAGIQTTKTPWPAKRIGWEITFSCSVWSNEGGAAEALEVLALMDAVLDVDHATSGLVATGYRIVRCWNEYADTSGRGDEGMTRGLPVRYRLWVQPAS